jgi:glycosyltransferase involved in cell wall biosynthesis
MRLAVVASHPVQYDAPLFRELAKRIDLTVFFGHRATPIDQSKAGFGVTFEWDVDLLSGYSSSFLRNVAKRPGIERFGECDTPEIGIRLREGRFDAVLLTGWYLKCFLQALFCAKRQQIPVLARGDCHLETARSRFKRTMKSIMYPPLLRSFDAALAVGKRAHAYWTHYHFPESHIFFSPRCVDTEWFATRATHEAGAALRARLGIAPASELLLFAGKLVAFKRPLDLIGAAARLNAEGRRVEVMVAGAGPLKEQMAIHARDAGVVLHLLGFCNQTEMPAAYAATNVLVLPSEGRETWGLVANEALACGCPIVVSDAVGCALDLVVDGRTGKVFHVGHVTELAHAIAELLDYGPSSQEIAAKSAAYSLDAAANGILRAARFVTHQN